ncbi:MULTISPECIES: type II toxin-antitoxin system Phd/YefM family antitoxin [Calothrix]|uniref:Antitoxin n=2 Tax=Calothrix TaxID=1186 RepID=A0ABR8AEG2_9CYAN|nr:MULTISPECIES: type II toxin-antitoxin system Phd/YefM family antitoxin [Calothrix]MBD2197605.1 type II toxin-antitoxin system Phd/YefM family antitoxin [Calothrix parietina FACHB-288]MBD2227439.1 type II toxin-antitoxin system Phd/YefM family antitoxin [Calothrix anomala FACHB-343]
MSIKITSEEAAKNLDTICNQLIDTNEVVRISRPDGKNVVLISETELESLLETLYLLRFPANSTRLFTALQRAKEKIVKPQSVSELYERLGLQEEDKSSDINLAS